MNVDLALFILSQRFQRPAPLHPVIQRDLDCFRAGVLLILGGRPSPDMELLSWDWDNGSVDVRFGIADGRPRTYEGLKFALTKDDAAYLVSRITLGIDSMWAGAPLFSVTGTETHKTLHCPNGETFTVFVPLPNALEIKEAKRRQHAANRDRKREYNRTIQKQ